MRVYLLFGVTHDQEEALSVGDRVGVLKEGIIQQIDSPERCFSLPSNRFVARFLGEASFIAGNCEGDIATTDLGNAPAIRVDHDTARLMYYFAQMMFTLFKMQLLAMVK